MPHPDPQVLARLVGEWVRKADQDLEAARVLLEREAPLRYPACFHAQQAVEKYLKAYLTRHQLDIPKTHNIRELLDRVARQYEALVEKLRPAMMLTPYGVEVRYPGDAPEPSPEEANQALALATTAAELIEPEIIPG